MKKIIVLAFFFSLLFTGIASASFVAFDTHSFGMKADATGLPTFTAFDTHSFGMKADATGGDVLPPVITINFAGNLGDSGGPYKRPPGEGALDTNADDGYYANATNQIEGWIYINVTASDVGGVPNVWLQLLNDTTWTNFTYPFVNTSGGYFEFNSSGNFSTASGFDYSFNVVANDTNGNSDWVGWNKTSLTGSSSMIPTRRSVSLNNTGSSIDYTLLYLYNFSYRNSDRLKPDRLIRDQGINGGYSDTGQINFTAPTSDVIHNRHCGQFVIYYFNNNSCVSDLILNNVYYHVWWSSNLTDIMMGYKECRGYPSSYSCSDVFVAYKSEARSSLDAIKYYWNDNLGPSGGNDSSIEPYYLTTTLFGADGENYSDNSIYEFAMFFTNTSGTISRLNVINNVSINSFVLLNVPDNATLNASHADSDSDSLSDWTELYVTYTNPFIADTDNDGINDYWENASGSDPNNFSETYNVSNTPPTLSGEAPVNGSTGVSTTPTLYVICTDVDGDTMNATWRSNSSNDWVDFGFTNTISSGTNISMPNGNFSSTSTMYWWSVNLSDGNSNWCNETYHLTTRADYTPDAPDSFFAVAFNKTQINITWTDHANADSTRVEWHTVADGTWNVGDHTLLYNGSAQLTTQGGLDPGTARYYKGWSWNETDDVWGAGSTSDATTDSNTAPTVTNPDPVNSSTGQNLAFSWSCTIEDDENLFNWTIECSNGDTNSANDASNGSKSLSISGLAYSTQYTAWINVTDHWGAVTDDWYTFTTKASTNFTAFDTHTFGMKAEVTDSEPIISNVDPSNGSSSIVAYPFLNITITDPSGLDMNVSWSTNASGSWLYWNSSVASGSTVRQRATFANTSDTKYWWTVKVNNTVGVWTNATYHFTLSNYTWGEWSGWWVVYYTDCDEPLNFTAQANSSSMIFLNWTMGNNSEYTHIRWDTSTYPTSISEGNLSCNITDHHSYEQSDLLAGTLYYFTAWGFDDRNETFSYNTSTTSNITDAGNNAPTQSGEAPVNDSTNIGLTPSLFVICSDVDSDIMNATWRSNSSNDWVDFASNASISTGTNITQPNSNFSACSTTYWWSVNLSDGNDGWDNGTYHFTTEPVSPPSSFTANVHNTTQINITWVKGTGADKTTILRNATGYAAYPNSPTNGTVIYNNTGTNYEDIGLAPGTNYYYTAWSWNTTQSVHSTENATDSATTNAPGEVVFSNLALSHTTRHTTSETSSPSDYINFTITATNVASIQINITDAHSVIHTESILANKSGNDYWCNRTIPESWGNGTYSVKIFASSASLNNESSSFSFNMYPVCDVNLNNWTTFTDITQVVGSNWGMNGVNRFVVEDVNGNGWVTFADITYMIDPNRWGAVTKP